MAFIGPQDRVLESTTTTGTGALALAGPVTGFRRFSAVCALGDTVPYFIEAVDSLGNPTGDYEYGTGTYSAANQLTRTTVDGSSNGGLAVNFAAGSKNVALTLTRSSLNTTIDARTLGAGQTWQDLTSSRAVNTTYTNTTGRPIQVSASVQGTVASSTIAVSWTIGGVVGINSVSVITGAVPGNTTLSATAIVPPGATYSLAVTQASLAGWRELR